MSPSGEEIRKRLADFAVEWRDYTGSERSEAQPFLTELLACYGTDRKQVGARFEERAGACFMDMIWPGVCIVEMKRPSEKTKLEGYRERAFDYWKDVQRETGNAGRFLVLCASTGSRCSSQEPGGTCRSPS